jgi:L-alanine-DL-glutamate epimerase-like enolase superfamily enzyme
MGAGFQSEAPIIQYCIDKALKPMITGKDPLAREYLWKQMFKNTTRFGRKGAMVRALSGVDIALWDLAGKAANMPCYKLIGYDKYKVPVYASGGYYAGYGDNDISGLLEEIQSYIERGYKAMKIKVGRKEVKEDIKRIAKVREAIGFDFDLMVDANEGWHINDAIRFCEGVKDLNLYWVEEPLEPDDLESHLTLSQRTNIPIASGETEYTKYGFLGLIRNGVRIIQPDATRVGGVTEWLKVAALGQCWNLPVVPHGVQEIHVTCMACANNGPFTEYFTSEHPLQQFISELFVQMNEGLEVKGGTIHPLDVPGMGLLYDPEVAKAYTVQR